MPRLVSRLVGIVCITPHTCCTSIRPGPAARPAKRSVVRRGDRGQLAQAVAQPASIRLYLHIRAQRDDRTGLHPVADAHENGVPTQVTTGYWNLCRMLDETADKPAMGSAVALPRNRCRLYDLGALGSPAFLDGQCGLSKSLARRFVSHCRSLLRSGNHLPRPYVRKNKKPPASLLACFSQACTHSFGGSARSRGCVVGSLQPGLGCLSDFSKRSVRRVRHHGDNTERSSCGGL